MNIGYWILAGSLALFYLYAGGAKLFRNREQLQPMMAWVDRTPMPVVRLLGTLEVMGAVGLILPPLTGIAAWLSLAAAGGLGILQIGATAVHLGRADRRIGLNIALFLAAAGTVWLSTTWW
ncbi:DoxX family protein [Sciscionella sediminilitoris]|uniref:DoxX family protein n=1 Tax=Sciscionella sediminilitoris TaxID=1445613 RepID=UPI0004DF8418|nr:DoxX family protein [Sciscionella sp. SE31]